jgi:hypothetical protein
MKHHSSGYYAKRGDYPMKIKKVMEGPRDGEIRCLACFTRFRPTQWRISWPYPKTARLQGPVWETYPKPGEPIRKK